MGYNDVPRAYRPEADPREQRRNLLIALAIVALIVAVVLGRKLLTGRDAVPVEVVVSGADGVRLEAGIEVRDGAGAKVAEGRSDSRTGVLALRLPPAAYRITATVSVRETDQGMANAYPSTLEALVVESAGAAQPFEIRFPTITLHPWKPGQYSIKK